MNFIEYLVGISPDGGSGQTEMLIFMALLVLLTMAVLGRKCSKKREAEAGAAEHSKA